MASLVLLMTLPIFPKQLVSQAFRDRKGSESNLHWRALCSLATHSMLNNLPLVLSEFDFEGSCQGKVSGGRTAMLMEG